jgi:hypothetical protein
LNTVSDLFSIIPCLFFKAHDRQWVFSMGLQALHRHFRCDTYTNVYHVKICLLNRINHDPLGIG